MSSAEYLLSSLGWSLGGAIASTIWWRFYYHRKLVELGAAKKEPPLMAFTAFIVIAVSCMGLLFGEANRLQFENYVDCQAAVAQTNVETINDRSKSAIVQLQNEIKFYNSLALVLSSPPDGTITTKVLAQLQQQIQTDQIRLRKIQTSPLQPTTSCHQHSS